MCSSHVRFPLTFNGVMAVLLAPAALAQTPADASAQAPVKSLGMVTVTSGPPTSLPTQIPATIEGATREQIEQTINATDSEDALKYLPSLLVRKRYIGDYNHAIVSSRASGTGNSARSAVYADGILLSNYLGNGTGWHNLALKGIWRPQGVAGAHIVDFGYQQDSYQLRILKSSTVGNWLSGGAGTLLSEVGGRTQLRSLYAQDAWTFAPKWKTVLGARVENWQASRGFTSFGVGNAANTAYAARSESAVSPKAALSYQWSADATLKASTGRAVRFPTVGELYGATASVNSQYINNPGLKPEKSWTSELTAEKDLGQGVLRVTLFSENTRDALYSQVVFDPAANSNISRVQNVGRIQTRGLELAFNGSDLMTKGLGFSGSLTYADSRIRENSGFVAVPGDTVGKYQPRVPVWRATAVLSCRLAPSWTGTLAARYSGQQFSSLDNSDVNGAAYMGSSKYFVTDVRFHYKVHKQWTAAFGIDNLNNDRYWNFHPYPQRTFMAELKVDL